jgi:hydrogenase-4 component B
VVWSPRITQTTGQLGRDGAHATLVPRGGPVYESQVTPVFARYLYRPVIRAAEWLADVVRPLQSGDVNLYLFYVFAMLLVAYLLGAI